MKKVNRRKQEPGKCQQKRDRIVLVRQTVRRGRQHVGQMRESIARLPLDTQRQANLNTKNTDQSIMAAWLLRAFLSQVAVTQSVLYVQIPNTQSPPSITCLLRVTPHGSPTAFHAAGVGVRPRSLRGDPSHKAIAEEDKVEIPTVGQLCRHNVRVAAARNCAELARCALSCKMRASSLIPIPSLF